MATDGIGTTGSRKAALQSFRTGRRYATCLSPDLVNLPASGFLVVMILAAMSQRYARNAKSDRWTTETARENAMDGTAKVEAVKGIISSLFASQRALRALAPEFKWAGLGNLLGDFGEFIATQEYGLTKASSGSNGYDAKTPDGKSVQVKTNHASSQIGFRGSADLMLVLHVSISGEWEEVYYGPFAPVLAGSRHSARDNKEMISITKLRALKAVLDASGPQAAAMAAAAIPDEVPITAPPNTATTV